MKWVTGKHIHVNRTATGWLIRRFLDPEAEILFVEPGEVAVVQQSEGAIGFDAPGARYPHRDEQGRCSFEQLVEEHLAQESALYRAGARPSQNTWIFFGGCSGSPTFQLCVQNLIGILRGADASILATGFDARLLEEALSALTRWKERPDAAFWFAVPWAQAIRP
jgi:hypothetical protein